MKTIKFGNRELNIKYGYKATLRGGLLKKIIQMSDIGANMESVERLLYRNFMRMSSATIQTMRRRKLKK